MSTVRVLQLLALTIGIVLFVSALVAWRRTGALHPGRLALASMLMGGSAVIGAFS